MSELTGFKTIDNFELPKIGSKVICRDERYPGIEMVLTYGYFGPDRCPEFLFYCPGPNNDTPSDFNVTHWRYVYE